MHLQNKMDGKVDAVVKKPIDILTPEDPTGVLPVPEESFDNETEIRLVPYSSELQMPAIIRLIKEDLSEPYSIYTYRYFIYNWPNLCWMVIKVMMHCVSLKRVFP